MVWHSTTPVNVLMAAFSIPYFRKRCSTMGKDAPPTLPAESGPPPLSPEEFPKQLEAANEAKLRKVLDKRSQ